MFKAHFPTSNGGLKAFNTRLSKRSGTPVCLASHARARAHTVRTLEYPSKSAPTMFRDREGECWRHLLPNEQTNQQAENQD